jgi:hypothetical protein
VLQVGTTEAARGPRRWSWPSRWRESHIGVGALARDRAHKVKKPIRRYDNEWGYAQRTVELVDLAARTVHIPVALARPR